MILQYQHYVITGTPEEIKQFIDLMEGAQINLSPRIGVAPDLYPYHSNDSVREYCTKPQCPKCKSRLTGWIGSDSTGLVKYKCENCGNVYEVSVDNL